LDPSRVPQHPVSSFSGSGNAQYLEFYYYHIGPMLSRRFDGDFWCGIVLQMAQAESSVRNAMIALAYLNQTQRGSLADARHDTSKKDVETSRQFGMHYNRAIRCLVARMSEASYAPETGLVTCVLFACIEFLRADKQNALLHMRNGLYIVSELRRTHGVDTLFRESRTKIIHNGISGPLEMIEKTLVPIFTQGLISALLHGVDVDMEFAFLESTLLNHLHLQTFNNLREARFSYCEMRDASIILARDFAIKLFQGLEPSPSEVERQTHVLACHQTWFRALVAFEESSALISEEDKLAMSTLKIGYYTTYTASACVHDASQMSFDVYLDSFKAIVYHADVLVNNTVNTPSSTQEQRMRSGAAANFTFDTCLVPALYYVALRCRHPSTRRAAIALLSRNLPREGLWDPGLYRIIAERIVEIEEKEVDGSGWPVERTRLWSASVTADVGEESGLRSDFLFARDVGRGMGNTWSEKKVPSVAELYVEVCNAT
jgi:hypothetical protein